MRSYDPIPPERRPEIPTSRQPHPKSMTRGELASHLADHPFRGQPTLTPSRFYPTPPGGEPYRTSVFTPWIEVLGRFDRNAVAARNAMTGTDDAKLTSSWSAAPGHPWSKWR